METFKAFEDYIIWNRDNRPSSQRFRDACSQAADYEMLHIRDDFGSYQERLLEDFRRGEFPGPEEKTVGELASADDEVFHIATPPVWLFP